MTPAEIELDARRRYNAVGDTFWTSPEIYSIIYQAEMEMAIDSKVIENAYTASTVASQQDYAWPSRAIEIKRVTYDGSKLDPINMREDDAITLLNSATTATGTPAFYFVWEKSIYLRPIPSAVAILKIWSYDMPDVVATSSQAIEVPAEYHPDIVHFVLSEMAAKDGNINLSNHYRELWGAAKVRARRQQKLRKRGDSPSHINDIDSLPQSLIGSV